MPRPEPHLIAALLASLATGAAAEIILPPSVDPGAPVTVRFDPPAPGGMIVLREFAEDGQGRLVLTQPLVPGAEAVPITAPLAAGSYLVERLEGGRVAERAALEVAAAPVMLEAPALVEAGEPLEVRWRGSAARGDRLEIAGPDGTVLSTLALAEAEAVGEGEGRARLPGPTGSGSYELRLRDGRTGIILARTRFDVDATRAFLRTRSFARAGERLDVGVFGPTGATFAVVLEGPDGRAVEEISLAGVERGGAVRLEAPGRRGDYRLHYRNLATGETLSTSVLKIR